MLNALIRFVTSSLLSVKIFARRQVIKLDSLFCKLLVSASFHQKLIHPSVVFVTQYYEPSNPSRFEEIKDCILHNVHQSWIDTSVLVCDPGSKPDLDFGTREVIVVQSRSRPSFYDLIRSAFIHIKDENTILVIANSDIFLDPLIEKIIPFIRNDDFIALTRYETPDSLFPYMQESSSPGEISRSQDAWIFKASLINSNLLESLKGLPIGVLGCENILANYFHKAGASISDPCCNIRIIHNHCSRVRSYTKDQRLTGEYSFPRTQSREQFILGRRFQSEHLLIDDIQSI